MRITIEHSGADAWGAESLKERIQALLPIDVVIVHRTRPRSDERPEAAAPFDATVVFGPPLRGMGRADYSVVDAYSRNFI